MLNFFTILLNDLYFICNSIVCDKAALFLYKVKVLVRNYIRITDLDTLIYIVKRAFDYAIGFIYYNYQLNRFLYCNFLVRGFTSTALFLKITNAIVVVLLVANTCVICACLTDATYISLLDREELTEAACLLHDTTKDVPLYGPEGTFVGNFIVALAWSSVLILCANSLYIEYVL